MKCPSCKADISPEGEATFKAPAAQPKTAAKARPGSRPAPNAPAAPAQPSTVPQTKKGGFFLDDPALG